MKHHPSSIVLSSISKVANKCLFSQWAVHFMSGAGIRSRLFSPLCKCPSLSLSLAVLDSFSRFLSLCQGLQVVVVVGGGGGGEEVTDQRRLSGGSVCLPSENRIHLCDPDAYAQLSASLFVCVAQSEERIGPLGWGEVSLVEEVEVGGQLTSARQLLYLHQRERPWPDDYSVQPP